RVDDLVADGRRGLHELVEDRDAAAGDVHLVEAHTVAGGEALAQAGGGGIRVSIDRGRSPKRLEHRGQRLERVLVAGELERIGARLLALPVRREGGDLWADAGKDRLGHESESTSVEAWCRRDSRWYHFGMAMNVRLPEELDQRLGELAARRHTSKHALLIQAAD